MDKLVRVFESQEFGQVRTAMIEDKPYAVGVDVARALGYVNPSKAVMDHCKGDFLTQKVIDGLGREQETRMIPEGDIYRLIVKAADQSANPEIKARAERFERWIFDEVLPQIRRTGSYSLDRLPTHLETAKALVAALEKQALLEAKIEQDKPKVEFYDAVAKAEGLHTMNEAAKILGIGPNILFSLLRGAGVLMTNPRNVPRQEFIQRRLFVTREKTFQRGAGAPQEIYCQTYVTGKGMEFLARFVREHVRQRGFPGHRPNGGKALKVLAHEFWDRAEQFGGMK